MRGNRQRVLLLPLNYPPEIISTGKYTGELASDLTASGFEVRVICAPPYYPKWRTEAGYGGWQYRWQRLNGVDVYRCPLWVPRIPSNLNRLVHLLSFGLSCLPVALAQAFWKPDIVLCVVPTLFSAPGALLVARLSGAKCWLHIQDFELDAALGLEMMPGGKLLAWLARAFERFVITRFDRVSTISDNMLALAVKKGVRQDRAVLLPNWVDTTQIHPLEGHNPLRAELDIGENEKVVLYHGNMGRKQGLEVLIEAAARLRHLEGVLFLLCGEGVARAELERRANGLPNIRFVGLQPEEKLNQLVNLAVVHVLPQRAGAADLVMPSKLTTMLASGRPVIACAAPGTQLWKVVSAVGRTVEPESAEQLAGAILALLDDPAECARLGRLGREYACKYLEKELVLGKFMSDLEVLVGETATAEASATI